MKLTVKTLMKLTFQVEIEPDKTVKELKEKIEKEQGKEFSSGVQKLIYNGKILSDESKLSEYEFDEKKFIVLMITRAPQPPKPAASSEDTLTSSSKQKSDEKPKLSTTSSRPTPASATTTSTAPVTTASTTTASTVSTSATASATTTATNTTSRPAPQNTASRNLSDLAGLSMGEPQLASRLAALMTQPHFRQMQDLIQQSPHLLSSTIESLAASDPEMYNFISENPDVFVNALNHPPLAGSRSSEQQQTGQARPRGAFQQPGMPSTPAEQVLGNVSEHDKEAIERLKELGFSEYLVVQAYMACDKDEQLAANLLFQMDQ